MDLDRWRPDQDVSEPAAPDAGGVPARLDVLGPPAIHHHGAPQAPGTQKALALAGYLAVRGEPVAREQLATLLWADSSSDQARRSLRGELGRLRAVLPDTAVGASRLHVWLEPSAVDTDIARFRTRLAAGHDRDAVELYRGPLLEGLDLRNAEPFEEWLQSERHLLEANHLAALRRLIRAARDRGDATGVLHWSWRAVRCQPLAEEFYVHAMQAADQLDDRPAVLSIYRQLAEVLRAEFGIGPGAEARALARRAARDDPPRPVTGTAGAAGRAVTDADTYVGRDAERRLLGDCVRGADAGHGRLAFVHGPAGAGKTRLLRVAFGDRRGVWCPAQRTVSTAAYYPIATGLRQYLARWGMPAADDPWLREAARVCPELSRATPNPSLGAPEDKVRLLEGLSATLAGAAGRGGVLVFDDVQWADPDTLAVIDDLVRRLPQLPVVIALAARGDQPPTGAGLAEILAAAAQADLLVDVPVPDLTRQQVVDLITTCCGDAGSRRPDGWLAEFAAMVHEVLGGNPFYALECARLALDGSTEPPAEPVAAVKFGVRDVVRTRLAALPPRLRQLAEAAAVAGEPLVPAVLAQMLDIDAWELADRCDALIDRGVLAAGCTVPRFAHDLLADVVYESLPTARRRLLHERAAQALVRAAADRLDEVSGQIAAHLEAAGQTEDAIPYHERAAEAARRSHAHQTALHHYQRLRGLVPPPRRVYLLLQLGELLSYQASREAEAVYREALALAETHGDGRAQACCYFALGVLSRRQLDLAGSERALTEALRRFTAYADTDGMQQALEALTYAYIQRGELAAAATAASHAAEIARDTGRLPNLGRATLSRGIAHLYGGEYARALRCFDTARGLARDTADELAEAEALRYLSGVCGVDGRLGTPNQAWAAAEQSAEICTRLGHRMGLARAADGAGGAYLAQGDWRRALDCYVTALHLTDTCGYVWGLDAMVYRVGYTLLRAGEHTGARRALGHAEALARRLNARYWLCRTLLATAELRLHDPDPRQAGQPARAALDLAERLQHRDFAAAARTLLDRAGTGRPVTATDDEPDARPAAGGPPLPDVPQMLRPPVHGVEAVLPWLDEVAHRQLGAFTAA